LKLQDRCGDIGEIGGAHVVIVLEGVGFAAGLEERKRG
jgi:hypothetical protein